jgi:hypothetical protein
MRVSGSRYSFSFITGSLFVRESVAVGRVLASEPDWKRVGAIVSERNLLRQRSRASEERMFREIRYRLEEFGGRELSFFLGGEPRDQSQLVFIAVCRHFRLVRDFMDGVILLRMRDFDHQLYPGDFQRFLDDRALEHPEIERLSEKSRAKIRQVILRMLVEAGLMETTASRQLRQPVVSAGLRGLLGETAPEDLRFLLVSGPTFPD